MPIDDPRPADSADDAPGGLQRPSLRQLFSFQLRRLNLLYSRASALIYGRDFGMTLNEWRLFAELHESGQPRVPFGHLTQQTGFDVGLASRIVDALVAKGLVVRLVDPRDARLREVSLTREGRAVGRRMLAIVQARNERLLSRLSPRERAALLRMMDALIDEAGAMLEEESARPPAAGARRAAPTPPARGTATTTRPARRASGKLA